MVRYFCDCCGKELKKRGNVFVWLCHLTDIANGKNPGWEGIDGIDEHDFSKSQPISGREDSAELCNKCYNEIVILSVKSLFETMKENGNVKF